MVDDLHRLNEILRPVGPPRVLEGVYFPSPAGTQPAVDGQTTIARIVGVFENRIAALPGSAVAG